MNSLLKKSFPKYTIKLPSGKKVSYRPITVREENSLLVAKQTQNQENILTTLIDVMNSCFEQDFKTFNISDFEYCFIHLRAKSIGEIENATIRCPKTQEEVRVNVDCIKDLKVKNNEIKNKIKIDDTVIHLNATTVNTILNNPDYNNSFEDKIKFIAQNIHSIEKENEIISGDDISLEEKIEFISNLSSKDFKKIVDYYDNESKIYFDLQYTTSDGSNNQIQLSGVFNIISFFLTI